MWSWESGSPGLLPRSPSGKFLDFFRLSFLICEVEQTMASIGWVSTICQAVGF